MSLRVMIIPEDPTYDRYIVQPIVEALLASLGRSARVETLMNPHMQGIEDAIATSPDVVARYPQHDVFVLVLDRDGNPGRAERLTALQEQIREGVRPDKPFLYCLAEQEVEVWLLAAQWTACRREYPSWSWADVRAAVDVKERYFQPFFQQHRNLRVPGQGRAQLMSGVDMAAVMAKCPELRELGRQLQDVLTSV